MTRKANGAKPAAARFDGEALRLMLIDAQREAEGLNLGLTCYLLGMAIRSVDEPDQAVPQGVVSRVEATLATST